MRIQRASIADFRNLREAKLEFSEHFTALLGPNGQGKTNTLEALYFLAALRPLRPAPRRSLLREGTEHARVQAKVHHRRTELTHELAVDLQPGQRKLLKDGTGTSTAAFLGHLVAVAFTPDDLDLAKGSPEGRRRFLDRALLNQQPSYLEGALRYQRALKERNRLLADRAPDASLMPFDIILARQGLEMVHRRQRLLAALLPRVRETFRAIASPAPELDARLRSHAAPDEEAYLRALQDRRAADRQRKKTTFGPHLDDLEILLDGRPAKERASQGQFRAIALAFKLSELTVQAETSQEPPVLLLDDMSSELDEARTENLFATVRRLDGQVVLTSTSTPEAVASVLGHPSDLRVYDVSEGTLRETP
jgi:DNA replication and repair protein RecF